MINTHLYSHYTYISSSITAMTFSIVPVRYDNVAVTTCDIVYYYYCYELCHDTTVVHLR